MGGSWMREGAERSGVCGGGGAVGVGWWRWLVGLVTHQGVFSCALSWLVESPLQCAALLSLNAMRQRATNKQNKKKISFAARSHSIRCCAHPAPLHCNNSSTRGSLTPTPSTSILARRRIPLDRFTGLDSISSRSVSQFDLPLRCSPIALHSATGSRFTRGRVSAFGAGRAVRSLQLPVLHGSASVLGA